MGAVFGDHWIRLLVIDSCDAKALAFVRSVKPLHI